MAMRNKQQEEQPDFWIPTSSIARSPGHPFYQRLNTILREAEFDRFVESRCERFYAKNGRPGIAPGVYMRMLLIGFFEGIDSERGIAWRCADSLSLRSFLGYDMSKSTPEHSSLSRIRQRLDVEVHQEVFGFVLKVLAQRGLLDAQSIGIDATTLEANAAMKSIVRRDDGTRYEDFLVSLAKASGIETPTRADLAKIDKQRKKKGSNDDWTNPNDPDAKITKLKDGRTHLAHKAEHSVDLDSGAVLAVTVQDATLGDPASLKRTIEATVENVLAVHHDPKCANALSPKALSEIVADKGYHSNETMRVVDESGIKSYVSEPRRGRRRWRGQESARAGTYANRRRLATKRGKALMRLRGEKLERTFAHCLETGGMRRVHLRGRTNILKRYLVHVAAFNLSLVMREIFGVGTPRGLQGRLAAIVALLRLWIGVIVRSVVSEASVELRSLRFATINFTPLAQLAMRPSSTGC
jgi:transposase